MIVQRFNLNLIPNQSPVVVHVNQYDTGTGRLIATLYEGNEPYSPNGTAVIQGTKPDGHGFQYSATLDGNVVTADLTEQMSPVAGDVRTQIVVTESSGVTGTFVFIMRVQPSALPSDADMSESDYPLIEEAIREAQEAVIDSHDNAENSEAWAQGTRGGIPVGPTDPTYEHNAEYWAHQAEGAATGVSSFNGRSGSVLPIAGDYDSEKILLASALHIGGETQNNVQGALEALVNDGGAGHTILNGLGQEMPQRKNLRFAGANVSDDAENDTTNVTISGGGSGGSTITVTTTETSLYGETITISDGTSTFTGVFDNSGVCVIDGVTATGTLTVSSGAASRTLNVPYFGNYTVVLSFWAATINVSTDPDVVSAIVKKDGVQIDTISFSAGSGVYVADSTGAYTFTATVGGIDFTSPTVNVTQQTTYSTIIDIFSATLSISTSSSELYGKTITIKKGSTTVGTTAFSAQGSASYTVHETGTYTCECEGYSGSATVSAETTYNVTINSANVTLNVTASVADGTTLTATNGTDTETATISNGKAGFNLSAGDWEVAGIPITVVSGQTYEEDVYVFAVHYSEADSNPDSADYPTGYDNYGWTPFAMNLSTGVPDYGSWNPSGTNADMLAWFYPKSCMVKYNGERDYYLKEDDESKKADGTTSDYNNTSYGGNCMMEWGQDGKRLYWKITADTNNNGWTFIVSNASVLNMKPWNHYDVNGDVADHWYTAKYFGSSDGTRMRSISGQSNYVNNTGTAEISLAEANNQTSDKLWTTEVFCDYMFIGMLCVLLSRSTNTQAKFGAGRTASGNPSAIGQGTMNGKGLFFGKSNGTDGVKIFGMENFFGNLYRRVRGLININGTYRIKMTYDQTDGSSVDGYNTDGSGYINAGAIGTTAAWVYPKHNIVRENCILAHTQGGSETTYIPDGTILTASGTFYALVGGDWDFAGYSGAFCVRLAYAVSDIGISFGAALSCKPLAE